MNEDKQPEEKEKGVITLKDEQAAELIERRAHETVETNKVTKVR